MDTAKRYTALDVFRGMTVALMILVNTPGSWQQVYAPLRHAPWHGLTPADWVFPFFLFAVGVSLFFSISLHPDAPKRQTLGHVARRVLIIFALGFFLNSFPPWSADFSTLRIMGVLQRIALAYGLAALGVLFVKRFWIGPLCAAMLLGYWGILAFFGGPDPYSLADNAALAFDRALLGEPHLYRGFGIPFDPEGLLSALPATVTVLIGYLAGTGLLRGAQGGRFVLRMALCGAALAVAGYVWGFVFPINKPLWTSSYVLVTAGLASIFLAGLIYVIDVLGYQKWTSVFSIFGANPLILFLLSGLIGRTLNKIIFVPDGQGGMMSAQTWLFKTLFSPLFGPMNGSLLYAIAHVFVLGLIGAFLYRKRIFIKV